MKPGTLFPNPWDLSLACQDCFAESGSEFRSRFSFGILSSSARPATEITAAIVSRPIRLIPRLGTAILRGLTLARVLRNTLVECVGVERQQVAVGARDECLAHVKYHLNGCIFKYGSVLPGWRNR